MGKMTVLALRVVLGLLLAGSVFVLAVMVPLLVIDLNEVEGDVPIVSIVSITVFGIFASQVILVCLWKLVTLVRTGTVFSDASFRYVDIIIGAITAGGLLVFGYAVALAPGDAVPPGIVLLICGVSLAVFGAALVVLMLRLLLAQAVARDAEATELQAELSEVI